jgi:predicted dehydrogenase
MNLALVGCDAAGERLGRIAISLGHTVTAVADAKPAQAKRVATQLEARASTRSLDVLRGVDAVLFAAPSSAETGAALRALRASAHVYWNAPLGADPRTAGRLLDAAKASGVVLGAGYASRECPQYTVAASQVEAGVAGKIGFVRVHRRAPRVASAKHGAALHALCDDIDFIAATFGPVATVFAQITRKKSVDSALLTLTIPRGPIVQCAASCVNEDSDPGRVRIDLCGKAGMIQVATGQPILTIDTHSSTSANPRVASSPLDPDPAARRLAVFLDAASRRRISANQFKRELHVVRIIEAVIESARSGRAVTVKR